MLDRQTIATRKSQIGDKSTEIPKNPLKKITKKKILLLLSFILFIAVTTVAAYSSWELYKIKSPGYAQKTAEQQTKKIMSAVGKLIELPDDIPQIATVSDVETLKKGQIFFSKAKNGDQLLVFQTMAILYRPSENKIINVGPINREQSKVEAQQVPSVEPTPSVKTNP
mgnify:CR=1 FL=1